MPSFPAPAVADLAGRLLPRFLPRFLAVTATLGALGAAGAPPARAEAPPLYETVVEAPGSDERPREDEAASASVITRGRTERSIESVPELLSELPGVSVTRLGGLGALATVSLRGSTSNQVLVYVDGVPLNTATGGGVDLGAVPLGDVERIEVYRGMSPIGFGASAIGGVVSITTREPTETTAAANAGGGSFGTWYAGAVGALAGRRVRIYAGAHALGSEGDFPYRSDNGTSFDPGDDRTLRRQNNALSQADGLLRATLPLPGRRALGAWLSLYEREQGVPGLGIYETRESGLGTTRVAGSATYESPSDLGAGGRLRAQVYATVVEQRFHDPLGEVAFVPTLSRDTTSAAGGTARLARPLGAAVKVAAVADGRYDLFQPRDDAVGSPTGAPASRLSGAAGAEADAWIRRLRLDVVPSARLELSRDVVSGRDSFGNQQPARPAVDRAIPVGRLALIERPAGGVTVRANLGRYARLPTTTELYGNTGFLLGNPGLAPEQGLNADLGAGVEAARSSVALALDAVAFGARVDDLIQFQENAQGRARAANVGRARIAGVEASATLRVGRHARIFAQGTFTDARDTSAAAAGRARQLPLRPRIRAYGRPEVRGLHLPGRLAASLYADVDVTGGDYLDSANLVAVPSRVVLGAGATVGRADGRLRLTVSALNLGDSRINDLAGFPLPGRSLFATLTWSRSDPGRAAEDGGGGR